MQDEGTGPLFIFGDGHFISQQKFMKEVREAFKEVVVDCTKYRDHNFRIEAATSREMEESIIMTLEARPVQTVKIPREQLARYSAMLCLYQG